LGARPVTVTITIWPSMSPVAGVAVMDGVAAPAGVVVTTAPTSTAVMAAVATILPQHLVMVPPYASGPTLTRLPQL
jgi:hypothetical protein